METRSNYVMVGMVTVALLAGVLVFIVWLAGLSNKATKCYDIYFAQDVGGLNKGSNVTFSGVPVGQVQRISLLPNRPEFVWIRINVDTQYRICDRVAVLADKNVVINAPLAEVERFDQPWVQEYFHGPRARAAQATHGHNLPRPQPQAT
jgi:hypothetical protein